VAWNLLIKPIKDFKELHEYGPPQCGNLVVGKFENMPFKKLVMFHPEGAIPFFLCAVFRATILEQYYLDFVCDMKSRQNS